MQKDIKSILFSEEEIKKKVAEIGKQITKDYEGKPLLVVGILKGGSVFATDLIRNISIPLELDFMAASSYGIAATESSGNVILTKELTLGVEDKHVLIVEDIIDSGNTLHALRDIIADRGTRSVEICALLDKPSRRKVDVEVKYVGFKIPDEFVVGYGLDYSEKYRNLPYIGILKPEVYQ